MYKYYYFINTTIFIIKINTIEIVKVNNNIFINKYKFIYNNNKNNNSTNKKNKGDNFIFILFINTIRNIYTKNKHYNNTFSPLFVFILFYVIDFSFSKLKILIFNQLYIYVYVYKVLLKY
ncbi:hypothetical protein PFAG_00834 [Plasmodium falciparum Santa Lucia]|uniref:Uncharacterized protein n=1 Tax=Plasmodium falciparum Santa Lucia TaxID=478859 RepID=W7G0K2_PLAFA|nr:hypothetical protein PFAG_00834 [Plasmodium falciparum Santa Lucia]